MLQSSNIETHGTAVFKSLRRGWGTMCNPTSCPSKSLMFVQSIKAPPRGAACRCRAVAQTHRSRHNLSCHVFQSLPEVWVTLFLIPLTLFGNVGGKNRTTVV